MNINDYCGRIMPKILRNEHPDKKPDEIEVMVSNFLAPEKKSMHSTGGAVDALIYDGESGRVLDFGTNDGYKIEHNEKCYPYHPGVSFRAKKNRNLLMSLFGREDFVCDLKEYWHFDYGNAIWAIEKGKKHAIFGVIEEKEQA